MTVDFRAIRDNGAPGYSSPGDVFVDDRSLTKGNRYFPAGARRISAEPVDGFEVVELTCDDYPSGTPIPIDSGVVQVVNGQDVRCDAVFDDLPSELLLNLEIRNVEDVDLAPDDVTVNIDEQPVAFGDLMIIDAGSYLIEYTEVDSHVESVTCESDGQIVTLPSHRGLARLDVSNDERLVCTVTYNDRPTKIAVDTILVNELGEFDYTGSGRIDGKPVSVERPAFVNPGPHKLSVDYAHLAQLVDMVCTNDETNGDVAIDDDGTLFVGFDERITCVITMTNPPHLRVFDDSGLPLDVRLDGKRLERRVVAEGPVEPGVHVISFTPVEGYFVLIRCDRSGHQDWSPPITDNKVELELKSGDDIRCEVMAADGPWSTIMIRQVVINDDGGTATPYDGETWTNSITLKHNEPIPVGYGHTVLESYFHGYESRLARCRNRETGELLEIGDMNDVVVPKSVDLLCVMIHNDLRTQIRFANRVVSNNGGSATADDVAIRFDGVEVGSDQWLTTTPGSHSVSFDELEGYEVQTFECTDRRRAVRLPIVDGKIDLVHGARILCVVRQNDLPTHMRVKAFARDVNGASIAVAPTVDGETTPDRSFEVSAGVFELDASLAGYELARVRCSNSRSTGSVTVEGTLVTVTPGAWANCVIVLRLER